MRRFIPYIIFLLFFLTSLFTASEAWAAVTSITGYNTNGNNGGTVPLIATSNAAATSVSFEYYDDDTENWLSIGTATVQTESGWAYYWYTGSICKPGITVRAYDNVDPNQYYSVSMRMQNVMANDIVGYRDSATGTIKVSADFSVSGQTLTWPEIFPGNTETPDRYTDMYGYSAFGTTGATPVAGNILEIRSDFYDRLLGSTQGTFKWKIFHGTSNSSMTTLYNSSTYTMLGGNVSWSVNFLNCPAGSHVGMYYTTYYSHYVNGYYSNCPEMINVYGTIVYYSGDSSGTLSFSSTTSYSGPRIQYTLSTFPPVVTQAEVGYSLDNGETWESVATGTINATQENTYDFVWDTKDIVSDNVFVGVRFFAGTWCSWYFEGPIEITNKLYVSVTNNLGFGTVDVEGDSYNVPYTGSWLYRTEYDISAPPVITKETEEGVRYAFTDWSDDGNLEHTVAMFYQDNPLIQANYIEEVTMQVSSEFSTEVEFSGWVTSDDYYHYEVVSPQQTDASTRFVCSGWTGTGSFTQGSGSSTGNVFINKPSTLTFNWYAEYMLRIVNEHGENGGAPAGWYADGSSIRCTSSEYTQLPASERYHCINWYSSGSLESGTGFDTGTFIMTEPTTIAWIFMLEVAVVVRSNHGTVKPAGTSWLPKQNLISVEATPPDDTDEIRYTWLGWTTPEDSITKIGEEALVYQVSKAGSLYAWWQAEYKIEVTSNGSLADDYSGWYLEGSEVSITSTAPSASDGERYLLSWEAEGNSMVSIAPSPATPNPHTFKILSPASIQATWVRQVLFTLGDPQSAGVNLEPVVGSYWHYVGDLVQGRVDFTYQGIFCTGYKGTGSIGNGTAPAFSFIISEPSTVIWLFGLRDTSYIPTPVWKQSVDVATNAFGSGCSVARLSNQSPVIAYTGAPFASSKIDGSLGADSIRVGWLRNGEWTTDIVDFYGDFGERVSVVVDDTDTPYVAYIKDSEACVAYYNGTEWVITAITSEYGATSYIDITLDDNQSPHVAFYASTISGLAHAYLENGLWNTEVVDEEGNVGQYCSIAVMPILNWVSISYYDSTNRSIKFARKEAGTWTIQTVDSGGDVGRNGSLALDPSGSPYICYQVQTVPANMGLRVAWLIPEGWEIIDLSTNDISGYDISMEIDEDGIIHVSYRDYTTLKYAWYNGITWGIGYSIAGSNVTGMTDISLDTNGSPAIVYWDGQDLKYVDTTGSNFDINIETDETAVSGSGGCGGGCFVATAAFGAYASSSVVKLTSFRDTVLSDSSVSSSLVALYYELSPVVATSLSESNSLRALARTLLK